jgi:uncharacterized protein
LFTEPVESSEGGTLLRVRVQPKASQNEIRMAPDGSLRLHITAPPLDNAANEAVVAYLSKILGVKKTSVVLTSGNHSRQKTFLIRNIAAPVILRILEINYKNK